MILFRLKLFFLHWKIYNFKYSMMVKWGNMYTGYLVRSGIIKKWFLRDIGYFDLKDNEISVELSDYKLNTHNNVSKHRWVYILFYKIGAGYGNGILYMDNKFYKITYSWGGLNSKENCHHRESYTVQIKKGNIEEHIKRIADKINKDENYPKKNYLVSEIFTGVIQDRKTIFG